MNTEAVVKKEKGCALVVEGGAMRGIFSTGVLDAFLENNFNPFDVCIGVSAGATNLASYLAGMAQRNYKVYTDYSVRPDFISWKKFILGGHLVDLDWLWDITIRELRLDLGKITSPGKEYFVGATDTASGKAIYFQPDESNLEELLKASSAIPVFYRNPVKIGDMQLVDGGLVDPIPVKEAFRRGGRRIMVIRSRPYTYTMKPNTNSLLYKFYLRKYPQLVAAILNRPKVYQEAIDFMRTPPEGIKILEINPPDTFQTKRLTKDIAILKQDYQCGYEVGVGIIKKWNNEE